MLLFAPMYNTFVCLSKNNETNENKINEGQFQINSDNKEVTKQEGKFKININEKNTINKNFLQIDGIILEDSIFDYYIIEQIFHNILVDKQIDLETLDNKIVFLKEKWGIDNILVIEKEGKNYIKIIGAKKAVYRDSTGKFLFPENKTDLTGAATKLADHASKSFVNRLIINWKEIQTILTGMYIGAEKRFVFKEEPITSVQDQDKHLSCYKSLIYLYNPTAYEIMKIAVSGGDQRLAQVVMHCEHNVLARLLKMLCGDSMSIYQKVNDKLESELNFKNSYSLWKKTVYLDPSDLCFVHYQINAPYAMRFNKVNIFSDFLNDKVRTKLENELFNNLNEMSTIEDLQNFFKKRKTHLKIESVETQINFKGQNEFNVTLNINLEKNTAEMMKNIWLRGDPQGSQGKILKFLLTLGYYYGAPKKDVEQRLINKLNKCYKINAFFDQDDLHVNFYGNVDRFTPADTPVSMNYKKMSFNIININFFLGVFTYLVVQPLVNFSFEIMQFNNIFHKNTAKALCVTGKATINHFMRATKDLWALCFAFELSLWGIWKIAHTIYEIVNGRENFSKLGKKLIKMCSLNWNIGLEHLLGTKYLNLSGFLRIKGRELVTNDCQFTGIMEKNLLELFKDQKSQPFIDHLWHNYNSRTLADEPGRKQEVPFKQEIVERADFRKSEIHNSVRDDVKSMNKQLIHNTAKKQEIIIDGKAVIKEGGKADSQSSVIYLNLELPYHFKIGGNKSCIVPNINIIKDTQYKNLWMLNGKLVFSTFDTFKLDNDTIRWSFAFGSGSVLAFWLLRWFFEESNYIKHNLLYKAGYCNEEDFYMFSPYTAMCFVGFNIEQVQLVDGFQDMKIISMGHGTFFNIGLILNPIYNRYHACHQSFKNIFFDKDNNNEFQEYGEDKKNAFANYILELITSVGVFPSISFGYKFEIKLMILKISVNAGWSTESIFYLIEEMNKTEFKWTKDDIIAFIFLFILSASIRLKMIPPDRGETRGMAL